MKRLQLILFIVVTVCITSCKNMQVSKQQFAGIWQYQEKSNFKEMTLKITCINDTVVGVIDSIPPNNKILNQYCTKGQKWLMDVERKSSNMFECKEARPGADLMGYYGLPSKTTYKMQLINDSMIGLSETGDPLKSKNYLKRIK